MTQLRPRQADETDQAIGAKIRDLRKARGITMKQLAAALGITYQQVQKYEIGTNRIPVSRLATIAELLGVSAGDFYQKLPESGFAEELQPPFGRLSTEEQRLLRAFSAIPSPEARKSLLAVANQMAQSFNSAEPNDEQ